MSGKRQEYHLVVSDASKSATGLLAQVSGFSHGQIKRAMHKGAVWIVRNKHVQRLRRVKKQLHIGDELHFYYDEQVLSSVPPVAQLIADERGYTVWFKPFGMLSQGSKWGDHCALYRWVEQHLKPQRPAFIVHRLDRAATGLILLAHSKSVAAILAKQFQNHTIEKRYRVTVHGKFPDNRTTINSDIDGRTALSRAGRLEYDEHRDRSLLEVEIESGRKHQIRRHLAQTGFPVVGDRLYGHSVDPEDLQLTACYLGFECPLTGDKKCYQLPVSLLPDFTLCCTQPPPTGPEFPG